MALDAATAQEMIRKLADDRANYLDTLSRAHEILAQALTAAAAGNENTSLPRLTAEAVRQNTRTARDFDSIQKDSTFSAEDDSDTDDDESLFVQESLPQENYDEDGFRKHVQQYNWTDAGRTILGDILKNEQFSKQPWVFPVKLGPVEDRSHLTHYSIFDVGNDGAPLPVWSASDSRPCSRALAIWKNLKNTNSDPARQRQAVGRIAILREPSPILFAAIHYTMKNHFDMDEVFQLLRDDKTRAIPHRPFASHPKHRSTFVFSLDYFTIIGDECHPMAWQKADIELRESEIHVPVSRCSCVIALSLGGEPSSKVRNKGRRVDRKTGDIFDPFAPWRVLSIQAYPDWKGSIDSHDSTKHYVNGPEAFLVTLKAEFKDAQKRLLEVYNRISDLVRTPPNFMFNLAVRDALLFEDDQFTYSRKYFWAHQSLGIMNEDIQEMITAYKTTFTDSVWNGTNKIIWPGDETTSSRYANWRKRMAILRKDIEHEIHQLEKIDKLNSEKMKEIKGLRDNLFSGTSVLESRKSVQQATITVEQGHNIKLLTLVTIFFLPMTFVTSVFGMTNMPQNDSFKSFGIVFAVTCIPTYFLIGSLNTTSGLQFWSSKTNRLLTWIGHSFAAFVALFGLKPKWTQAYHTKRNERPIPDFGAAPPRKFRSLSASEGMAARGGDVSATPTGANTSALSAAPTLERQHLTVPTNATVRFEGDKKSSSELPRTPTENVERLEYAEPTSTGSAGLVDKVTESEATQTTERPVLMNWYSRLFSWGRKAKTRGDGRELC